MTDLPLEAALTGRLLMVRPARFGPNPETAASNAFQSAVDPARLAEIHARARAEFDGLTELLRTHGIEVCVIEDDPSTGTPDAVFPNNWVSFHTDGTVVLYPMQAPNRRLERRPAVIAEVCARLGVAVTRELDLSVANEERGTFLEGTGSLILDRPRRRAYACLSPRTHPAALADFAQRTGYEVHSFHAVDEGGVPLYHTNVLMALGEGFCLLCPEALPDPLERGALLRSLAASGHELIAITPAQLREFAGNLLQVVNPAGERFIVGSDRAFAALDTAQIGALEAHGRLLSAPLDTIETVGGGGARCMLAEVFLPPAR